MKTLSNYILEKKLGTQELEPNEENLKRLWKELEMPDDKLNDLISNDKWDEISDIISKAVEKKDKKIGLK